ncbi:MAG: ABC transporter permease [Clostridia bacterium]|nr:ABC transporter permease [Clostridia bacterium]
MRAIFKREADAYFHSMLGYVFLTLFLLLAGVMFFFNNLMSMSASMTGFFSNMISWSIFILPILTMRLFAEDRKTKTEQLLLTAPVSIPEIVLGKFFGAMWVFLCAMLVFVFFPIVMNFYGSVPVAETISCFIGFILFGAAIISIGAFMSAITESQIIAAISTYAVMLVVMFMTSAASSVGRELLSNIIVFVSHI